jgi:DNA polymerase III delta prime subunit
MSYEWLGDARNQFVRLSAQLPHAILIQSQPGVGKHQLAIEIVASLLCEAPLKQEESLRACGACRNCTMFNSGNHPDFHYISSERYVESDESVSSPYAERYLEAPEKRGKRKPRKIISVDQIRALIESFGLSNHSADNKVALIVPADGADPTQEEIIAFCADRLAKYKTPRSIDFISEMPRDPNGKLYKRKLRDPYWDGKSRQI